jgi:arylsulfatase A-like enzyme
MREPTIMRWPGRLPAGRVCDRLASALDLLPTLAAYAGADLPSGPEHRIDGVSIVRLLEDPGSPSPHTCFFYYESDTGLLEAVRDAAGWKLHLRKDLIPVKELFYLPEDIGESDNIYPQNREVADRLRRSAEAFDQEITANQRPVGEAPLR